MAEAGNGATLRTYLVVLRRRKWWVIALAVLGLAVSLALSVRQAKQYSATAQLLVQSSGQGVSLGGAPPAVTTTDVQTDLQLATSAPVVALVRGKLGSVPSVSVSEVAQTNVIALTAISPTPARAALVANTYARAFVEQTQTSAIRNLTTASTTLHQQINALGRQITSLQKRAGTATQVGALINQQAVLKEEVAQLQVNGATATSGVEFVTPAHAPASPSSPKPAQDALLGLAAGLMLGLGAAFLRDSLDDTLTSKEAAERTSGAPVIAMVPMVSSWRKRNRAEIASSAAPTSPGRRGLPVAAHLTAVHPARQRTAHAARDQPRRRGGEDVHPGQPGCGVRPGRGAGGPGVVRPAPAPPRPVLRHAGAIRPDHGPARAADAGAGPAAGSRL